MAAGDESRLYLFDPSDMPGAEERRADLALQPAEPHRRYTEFLARCWSVVMM